MPKAIHRRRSVKTVLPSETAPMSLEELFPDEAEDLREWWAGLSEFFRSIAVEIYQSPHVMPCVEWEDIRAALGDESKVIKATVDLSELSDEAIMDAVTSALADAPSPPIGLLALLYGRRGLLRLRSVTPLRNATAALCPTALCACRHGFEGDTPGKLVVWYRVAQ